MGEEFRMRLEEVRTKIRSACRASGRKESDVTLVAVSKTKPWQDIEAFARLGILNFGENYVQEALKKREMAQDAGLNQLRWHLIGTLQSNKAKFIPGNFSVFHALDSINLAKKLNQAALQEGVIQECFLEVNVDEESTKGGFAEATLPESLEKANELTSLSITGLMCIPAPRDTRKAFEKLRNLLDSLNDRGAYHSTLKNLSMGMSADFESAILEGSTHIRVGSTLFGKREKA